MPGLPSTVSETELPTGCTKQLISVTSRIPDPAAELIRPPGMNPSSSAFRNAASYAAGSASTAASARATRCRTARAASGPSRSRSAPLAYFSRSTSRLTSCQGRSGIAASKARVGLVHGGLRSAGRRRKSRISCGMLRFHI